ncbi:MAG TPA: asparagine synthase (glutamine-hydrolyzing) [Bdellovibrionota bacterium]|jgi:asparagine synthase (glutamine-hydrolysing)
MCGIVAAFGTQERKESRKVLRDSLLLSLQHRGPDGLRSWDSPDGRVSLGHARLAVIDRESGWQPMVDPATGAALTYNGEIYNYRELRNELQVSGVKFKTESDAEVLLQSYLRWGKNCLSRLNGIFAFALYDPREKSLFLARDRLGVKPLYFRFEEREMLVASELRPLALVSTAKPRLSQTGVVHFLTMGYVLTPDTIVEGVRQLPAGHWALWNGQELRQGRYYDPKDEIVQEKVRRKAELQEEFTELFSAAVKRQLVSDIPVGVALSGGIDSSLLAVHANRHSSSPLPCFTVDFATRGYSELEQAKCTAQQFQAKHFIGALGETLSKEAFAQAAWSCDAPIFDSSFVPTSQLFALAKPELSVLLTGEGGDELFLGYETHRADRLAQIFSVIPKRARQAIASVLPSLLPVRQGKVTTSYKLQRFFSEFQHEIASAHWGWRALLREESLRSLLRPEARQLFDEHHPRRRFQEIFARLPKEGEMLTRLSCLDLETWLANSILVKTDRASMAYGVEARVPYLDAELVRFALGLTDSEKFSLWEPKKILRNALKAALPSHPQGPKKGFTAPAGQWIAELIPENPGLWESEALRPILDPSVLKSMLQAHRSGNGEHSYFLWAVATLNAWWEQLLEKHESRRRNPAQGLKDPENKEFARPVV